MMAEPEKPKEQESFYVSILIYNYEDKESGYISETKYCMYFVKKK